jgi:uncharacterized protein YjdB
MRSKRSSLTSLPLWGLAATVLAACTTATDPEPVASFVLQPTLDSVEVGETFSRWIVTLKDAAGNTLTGRRLTWESNNTAIATIDPSTGVLTAVTSGQTVVTARVEGLTAQSTIKVLLPVLSIIIAPDSFDLPLTTTRTISPQLVGPGGVALTNRGINWASVNPSVAVVNTSGLVTPVALGTTTIQVSAGQLTKNVRVRVIGEPVFGIRILPPGSVHIIRLGQAKQLTGECVNAALQVMTGRSITWNSSNPVVATVSGTGLVSGHALGSANITGTCDGTVSATVTAQVTQVPVSSVTISPNGLTIADNTQAQLTAVARDSANNVLSLQGRQVIWTTNNNPVASVNTQGVVSGTNPGTAEITVSVDGVVSPPITVNVTSFVTALIGPVDRPVWMRRAEFLTR